MIFSNVEAEFDQLLKDSGFVDIEQGADMSDFDASTFPGGSDHDPAFDLPENQPSAVKRTTIKRGKRITPWA